MAHSNYDVKNTGNGKEKIKIGSISYDTSDRVGSGGFGNVFIGFCTIESTHKAAIKQVWKKGSRAFQFSEREAANLQNMNHPHVIKLYHVEETEKYW